MKTVYLLRTETSAQGTFGVLMHEDVALHTMELPARNNLPNISCIPAGEYKVTRRYSPSFRREVYWVRDVPGRSYILIHPANFAGDTERGYQTHLQGCIALGCVRAEAKNKYGKRQKCISRSREALHLFETALDQKDFKLIIKDMT